MKFYNKSTKNSYVELLSYYPLFYHEVYEMTEILKAQGMLLDGIESSIEQIFSNRFINAADDNTLSEYEKILNISAGDRTIEERRKIVKAYLIGAGKISASVIKEIIGSYTGSEVDCHLEANDESGNNKLVICTDRGFEYRIDAGIIDDFLSQKLPAHLSCEFSIGYDFSLNLDFSIDVFETSLPMCGSILCGQYPLGGG